MMNGKRQKSLAERTFQVLFGLAISSFGQYLCVCANIGLAPWDCLAMGLSHYFHLNFGNSCSMISFMIVMIDLFFKEKIGVGTLLDAALVGQYVNLYCHLRFVPEATSIVRGIGYMMIGFLLLALGQTVYVAAGIGCGPRDSLMLALGKRIRNIPMSCVMFFLLVGITLFGWLLGGSIGIGTILSVFLIGAAMQVIYWMFRIELRDVNHIDVIQYVQLLGRNIDWNGRESQK